MHSDLSPSWQHLGPLEVINQLLLTDLARAVLFIYLLSVLYIARPSEKVYTNIVINIYQKIAI